jgi:hypothetical protein
MSFFVVRQRSGTKPTNKVTDNRESFLHIKMGSYVCWRDARVTFSRC